MKPTRLHSTRLRAALGIGVLALSAGITVNAQQWFGMDLGNPTHKGSVAANPSNPSWLDINGGGADIWGTSDACYYYYAWASGSQWEAVVAVQDMQGGATDWAKTELMVRWSDPVAGPQANDAFIAQMVTKPSGQNQLGPQFRTTRNGSADQWNPAAGVVRPVYPQWIKIGRTNSVFSLSYSADGTTWTDEVDIDTAATTLTGADNGTKFGTAWPDLVTVGIAVTAHTDTDASGTTATVSGLRATFPAITPPTVLAATQDLPASATVGFGKEVSFTYTATNNAVPNVLSWPTYQSYQWYKNGAAINGATGTQLTLLAFETGAQIYCKATMKSPFNVNVPNGVQSATATIQLSNTAATATYYTNAIKEEYIKSTSRVDVENGFGPPATWIGAPPIFADNGLGNDYVTRFSGWFLPPTTAAYTFFVACDDDSDLFLSTDANPANKRMIAQEPGYSGTFSWLSSGSGGSSDAMQKRSDQWVPDPNNPTLPPFANGISLNAGQPYYIELVHHQGGGGDNVAVTYQTAAMMANPNWTLIFTNGSQPLLIGSNSTPNIMLATTPITTLTWSPAPANVDIYQGDNAVFSCTAATDGEFVPKYTWFAVGNATPVGTGNSYTVTLPSPSDTGKQFYAVAVTQEGGLSITSSVVSLTVRQAPWEAGRAKVEHWFSITDRTLVENGTAGIPDHTITSPRFEACVSGNFRDNFVTRVSGFFIPPSSASYIFFTCSDDDSDLWVSTDDKVANKRLVAQETGWSGSWLWNSQGGGGSLTQKRSDSWVPDPNNPPATPPYANGIYMIGGQKYYMEVIRHDGTGGEDVCVNYKTTTEPELTDGTDSRLKGALIGMYAKPSQWVAFTTQPADASVNVFDYAQFSALGATDSQTAIGPTGDPSAYWDNFVIYQWQKNGVDIPDATAATLRIGPLLPQDDGAQIVCKIRAMGYSDINGNPKWSNSVAAIVHIAGKPVYEAGYARVEFWGMGNDPGRVNVENGNYTSPSFITTTPRFEAQTDNADYAPWINYTRRISGFFQPSVTGDYVFFQCSDDDSDLFLSTDMSPANKRLIAQETGWSGAWSWQTVGSGSATQRRSDQYTDASGNQPYINGIHLVQGQKYYIESVQHQGTGGGNVETTFKLNTDADPNTGTDSAIYDGVLGTYVPACGYVAFTQQPQSVTVNNFASASFTVAGATDSQTSVGVTGVPVTNVFLMFQWMKNGVNIPGATGSKLTLNGLLPSDTGAQIVCKMRALGLADNSGNAIWSNSQPASLTVTPVPPHLLYAGIYTNWASTNFGTPAVTYVSLAFDNPMDAVKLASVSSYTVGGGLLVTGVQVNTNDYRSVNLAVSGTPAFPFSVTVNGMTDVAGQAVPAGSNVQPVQRMSMTPVDIGAIPGSDPVVASEIYLVNTNAFTVRAEGSDIWNNADGFNFIYEKKSGDFDVVVRQIDITHTSHWAKGGLMVRESLAAGSREWNIVNDPVNSDGIMAPDNSGLGANAVECNHRPAVDQASSGWGTNSTTAVPAYPNAWVRLKRVGSTLSAFASADGGAWTQLAFQETSTNAEGALAQTVYVGICTTAHNNDTGTLPPGTFINTAHYAGYNSAYVPIIWSQPKITITMSGSDAIISWNAASGTLYASPALGAAADWQPVGTANPATITNVKGAGAAKYYRVVIPSP